MQRETMVPGVRYRVLHRGQGATLCDWTCIPSHSGLGPEEATDRHAIVFVRRGIFRKHQGAECIVADAGAVLFFNQDQGYAVSHPACSGDRCTVVTVSEEFANEVLAAMQVQNPVPRGEFFGIAHGYVGSSAMLAVRDAAIAAEAGDDLETGARLLGLVSVALQIQARCVPSRSRLSHSARSQVVSRVKEIASSRFTERLSLEVFSAETGYSPYHLLRVFRESTGFPIHRYVNRLRLLHALERFDRSIPPVDLSRIAFDLGFCSHSHFTSAFRAEFGVTPVSLRTRWSSERAKSLRSDVGSR